MIPVPNSGYEEGSTATLTVIFVRAASGRLQVPSLWFRGILCAIPCAGNESRAQRTANDSRDFAEITGFRTEPRIQRRFMPMKPTPTMPIRTIVLTRVVAVLY